METGIMIAIRIQEIRGTIRNIKAGFDPGGFRTPL
jgi:hypothetical protein